MCEFKILYDCRFGVVFQCEQCGGMTVAFGTVSLTLSQAEFQLLCQKAASGLAFFEPRVEGPLIKQIPFWRINDFTTIVLNLEELRQLSQMLQKAKSKMVVFEPKSFASELIARFPTCQS
jgi:hypothetical protein